MLERKEQNGFSFIDEGQGEVLLLLHGLFGALSNWGEVVNHFSPNYRVLIPVLPIYEDVAEASVAGLADYLEQFIAFAGLTEFTLIGNSLGGHVGLVYTLRHPDKVRRLVLTGSSGLFENGLGGSFPKRGSYDYIQERVAYTFYDPKTASKDLIDEVFEITKSIPKCMRIVYIARNAQRENLADQLHQIQVPTLLVWGLNDTITPPAVAHEFNRLIPNSRLRFIDKCCHAPMMEHPTKFNQITEQFLEQTALIPS